MNFVEQPRSSLQARVIFWCLLTEHIFNYASTFIKRSLVRKNGSPDEYGVMRSVQEIKLNSFGMLYAAIILGWSVNYLAFLKSEERLQDPFFISWLTIDCIILMVQLVYSYIQKVALKNGEIIKNIYTMKTVQENQMKKNSLIAKIKSL